MEPFGLLAEEPWGPMLEGFFAEMPVIPFPMDEMIEMPTRAITMEENEKEFVVRAELPGFTPEELTVELRGDVLVVEAEHRVPAETTAATRERAYAHLRRMITLPPEVELEKMEALYRNGVLEVRVPRTPEAESRRIPVRTEAPPAPEATPVTPEAAPSA